ncbi:MAG: hypothetical protein CMJ78_25715 [Planctomycetaceae bacterium]|nr:hypothetical protein [Planctomycetaceae bacterium]
MSSARQFGLLLISGNQTHQENYARGFAADSRCKLIGLTDEPYLPERRQRLNRQLADELEVPYLEDLDAAINREDVDFVCLCPDPERRGRLAAKCARAGKHIYVDKPMTSNVDDARDVVAAVEESGVLSQMFSLVRSSAARRAREVIESGRIGKLIGLHCEQTFSKGKSGTADLSKPRVEKAEATRFTFIDSKRELFCVGLYPLVLFQWLTGEKIASVSGTTHNFFFKEHQANDVEDFACLLMKTTGGLDATITCGRTGWSSHRSHGVFLIHLIGTEDAVTIDAFEPRLSVCSNAPAWQEPSDPHPEDPMGFWSSTQASGGVTPKLDWWPLETAGSDQMHFLDCLEQNQPSDVPAAVGAHAVEAIHAAYESAAMHETVALG